MFYIIWYILGFLGIYASIQYTRQDFAKMWRTDKWLILWVSCIGPINLIVFLLDYVTDKFKPFK